MSERACESSTPSSGTGRPELAHDVRITDTTLRDGSHAMAHQFTETQVRDTVRALDVVPGAHAATTFRCARSSPTRAAAAVMMSRFPA
ncbi:MAG: 4-hydroxy 2-oxovalerate aldolase [Pseudonocardiales bacterium]|nr:4-hydroxy 2-oxovalerate aldolase [Pseudonocardiales bacterium]